MCKRCNGTGQGSYWRLNPDVQREMSRRGADAWRKHGMALHPLYRTWQGMMHRCYDPGHVGFRNYGARGITVCEPWHDVRAFVTWIEQNLGPRPDGCTMDRIDNDRGYEPGNARWASKRHQQANQRQGIRPVGSAKPFATLTEDIVRKCRTRWAAGEGQKELATEFGVSKPTMHKALVGKTWQHVTAAQAHG